MIDPLTGAALTEAITGLTAAMAGESLAEAWESQGMGDDLGIGFGYAYNTTSKPSITGDTSGTITNSDQPDPVDAFNDYVENTPDISVDSTTGGISSGSNIATNVYSLLQTYPEAGTEVVKAVVPYGVPIEQAYIAAAQVLGVSMDAAQMDVETKQKFANSITAGTSLIYDRAKGLAKAWWDGVHILFPKATLEAVQSVIDDLGIGEQGGMVLPADTELSPSPDPYPVPVISGTIFFEAGRSRPSKTLEIFDGAVSAWYTSIPTSGGITVRFICAASEKNTLCLRVKYGDGGISEYYTSAGPYTFNGKSVYYSFPSEIVDLTDYNKSLLEVFPTGGNKTAAWVSLYGNRIEGGYPEGTSESQATKYTPATVPSAGGIATSATDTIPVVPVNITDNPTDTSGSTADPTGPTDQNEVDKLPIPVPLPIPNTGTSNPDIPLVDSSVVNADLVNQAVEELANTVDPQPAQSSGLIPIAPMPGVYDPSTGISSYPSIIPDSNTGSGLIHVYNPTPSEFVAFGQWLWVTYADATIEKIWNNPFDGIIGAHELYATPAVDGRDNIRSGFLVCPVVSNLVRQRYTEIDCGTIIVPEFYGNYLDYEPYSQCYIYLPFIGINQVSIDDIVGHAVNIRYRVDSYNGSTIAMIYVAKDGYRNLCYQFAGNCAVEVPLAGGSQAAIKAGMMQAEAYARAGMVSAVGHAVGGIGSALMGSLGGAISSLSSIAGDYANAKAGVEAAKVANKSSVQHSGQFGASHGAMGEKVPFIIIRNPIQVKVPNYNDDYGFPAHKRVIVGGCSGYLRVREVNVISATATDDEKAMIEAMLKNGVYVS